MGVYDVDVWMYGGRLVDLWQMVDLQKKDASCRTENQANQINQTCLGTTSNMRLHIRDYLLEN